MRDGDNELVLLRRCQVTVMKTKVKRRSQIIYSNAFLFLNDYVSYQPETPYQTCSAPGLLGSDSN